MFTFGFYNSMNGDRKYDAIQISQIFDGIIEDGVYSNVEEVFAVVPGTGLQVIVKTGRAWFKHTWNHNDSWMPINLEDADLLRDRIDSVVIEVNSNLEARENSIKIVKGTPASSPIPPTMIHSNGIDQYRLANVIVKAAASSITESEIENTIGRGETPFVTAPLKSVDISDLYEQWNGQFKEWFADVKAQLEGDIVTNLLYQIGERVKIEDKATEEDIKNGTEGKWVDAALAKRDLTGLVSGLKIGDIVYSTRDLEAETGGKMIKCDQREIKKDEYPELFMMPFIQARLPMILTGTNGNMISGVVSDSMDDDNKVFLGGSVHHGYIYSFVIGTRTLSRSRIRSDGIDAAETVGAFPFGARGFLYFDDVNAYWITSGTTWYAMDVNTGALISYSDSNTVPTIGITPIKNSGYVRYDDGILLYYGESGAWYYMEFTKDFSSRKYGMITESNLKSFIPHNKITHEAYVNTDGDVYFIAHHTGTSPGFDGLYKKSKGSDNFSLVNLSENPTFSESGTIYPMATDDYIFIMIMKSKSSNTEIRKYKKNGTFVATWTVMYATVPTTNNSCPMVLSFDKKKLIIYGRDTSNDPQVTWSDIILNNEKYVYSTIFYNNTTNSDGIDIACLWEDTNEKTYEPLILTTCAYNCIPTYDMERQNVYNKPVGGNGSIENVLIVYDSSIDDYILIPVRSSLTSALYIFNSDYFAVKQNTNVYIRKNDTRIAPYIRNAYIKALD